MGLPAARVGDMHVCPMVTGVVPHVGGPVLPPGTPTVFIGKMPAACLGDMCTCTGPPDVIMKGSAGVFIGGKPAARMGDMTSHGGTIVLGCFTVFIGEAGGGGGGGAGAGGNSKMSKVGASQAKDSKNGEALKKAAQDGDSTADKTQKEDFKAQFTLNDEAGKPLSDVKYEIATSDGQTHDGKSDGCGKTQNLSGYTIGDCRITFFLKK